MKNSKIYNKMLSTVVLAVSFLSNSRYLYASNEQSKNIVLETFEIKNEETEFSEIPTSLIGSLITSGPYAIISEPVINIEEINNKNKEELHPKNESIPSLENQINISHNTVRLFISQNIYHDFIKYYEDITAYLLNNNSKKRVIFGSDLTKEININNNEVKNMIYACRFIHNNGSLHFDASYINIVNNIVSRKESYACNYHNFFVSNEDKLSIGSPKTEILNLSKNILYNNTAKADLFLTNYGCLKIEGKRIHINYNDVSSSTRKHCEYSNNSLIVNNGTTNIGLEHGVTELVKISHNILTEKYYNNNIFSGKAMIYNSNILNINGKGIIISENIIPIFDGFNNTNFEGFSLLFSNEENGIINITFHGDNAFMNLTKNFNKKTVDFYLKTAEAKVNMINNSNDIAKIIFNYGIISNKNREKIRLSFTGREYGFELFNVEEITIGEAFFSQKVTFNVTDNNRSILNGNSANSKIFTEGEGEIEFNIKRKNNNNNNVNIVNLVENFSNLEEIFEQGKISLSNKSNAKLSLDKENKKLVAIFEEEEETNESTAFFPAINELFE